MLKLRYITPRITYETKHEYLGEKWINTWEKYSQKILQYSLDGETWYDVECSYVDIPLEDSHKYKWEPEIRNNKITKLK